MNFGNTALQSLIVHYSGNKNNGEPLHLSQQAVDLTEELKTLLGESFLLRFSNNHEWQRFDHPSSLQFNQAYNYCKQIFSDGHLFEETSQALAKHLYAQSTHPKIKGGELYVAYFNALPVEGRVCKAIGLFKAESKALFLETDQTGNDIHLQLKEGIEPAKIDKGCLVIAQKEEEGYDVLCFDNQSRGEEAQYWKEKFLGLSPQKNEFHNTQHFLTLAKQFITGPLESEHQVSKSEQVDLLHKSLGYFKSNESFDIDDFQAKVFVEDERIEAFRSFGSRYVQSNDFDLAAQFDISPEAVKKQSRIFKSVIKLDRNFHIYVHGRTDLIEKGVDTDGRKYYKIYYQDEA